VKTVLVVGLGEVGIRAARQLIDTPGIDRVIVAARHLEHARAVATTLHDGAEPYRLGRDDPLPDEVDAVVTALPGEADAPLARRAVAAGIPYASAADRDATLRSLLALDVEAKAHSTRVVGGCGLAPGLTDVLARHAVGALDAVDELHVARWGVAGSESVAEARRAQREEAREWRDGELVHEKHRHAELIWYPDPVGARECELVATGVELLVAANPGAGRVTARLGVPPSKRFTPPGRRDPGAGWGAVRVEAWGWRGTARTSVVYGVIERTAVAAGTVLGVTGASLAGALPDVAPAPTPGALGLGEVVDPVPFLAELARRGVKAAAFEGVAVA
jgi:Shikimate / quinate 5-dehydrogenase